MTPEITKTPHQRRVMFVIVGTDEFQLVLERVQ